MAEGKRLAFRHMASEGGNETESANRNLTWSRRRIESWICREKGNEIAKVWRRRGAFCLCGRGSESGEGEGKWIGRLHGAYGGHIQETSIANEQVSVTASASSSAVVVSGHACPRRETEVEENGPFFCAHRPCPSAVVRLWDQLVVGEEALHGRPLACRGHRTSSSRHHASFAPPPTSSFAPPFSFYPPAFACPSPHAQPYV